VASKKKDFVLFRPMSLPIALFPSPQLCVLPNSPISRFSQKNRVVSKHSGGGRAQSPLHRARDSECFCTATSPKVCLCKERKSLVGYRYLTGEGRVDRRCQGRGREG
jgi:hypothetical protein